MDFVRQGIADGCRQSGLATVDSVGNTPITAQYAVLRTAAAQRLLYGRSSWPNAAAQQ